MSTEQNKAVVRDFCDLFGRSAIDEALGMMTDDATWWVNGKPHLFAGSGTRTRAEMAVIWPGLYAALDGGLHMNVLDMIAEGDRVAAEIRSHAVTRTGQVYENDYHMLFTLRDGKVARVKEYTDLMHAAEIFG